MQWPIRWAAWGAAVAWLGLVGPAFAAEGMKPCRAPASVTLTTRPMPDVAAALHQGSTVDVLALGSASLLGRHGGEAGSVPDRMVAALRARLPNAAIRLTMRAGRTESAADMLATMKQELGPHRYRLVLWQSGTIEALRRLPPEQFRRTLEEGVALATASGADVVLIDMQYSHLLKEHADLAPYRAAMTQAALHPGAMLFPRFALMRAWAEDGQLDLETTPKADRRLAVARLHACLGDALADMLLRATGTDHPS